MSVPGLVEIVQHPERVDAVDRNTAAVLLGHLEAIRARLWTRLLAHYGDDHRYGESDAREEDRLLTPDDAARLLRVTVTWLYRHHKQLPFSRRISRKVLRFSERGLRQWMAHKQGRG